MEVIKNALNKATKDGAFDMNEVLAIVQSIMAVEAELKEYKDIKEKEKTKEKK